VYWYIVGWLAAERGNARFAGSLIAKTAARYAIVLDTLTAYSDRRAPMTPRVDDAAHSPTRFLANVSTTLVRSSHDCSQHDRAQAGSRAVKPPSEPLTRLITVATLRPSGRKHARSSQTFAD
jgi:hypothetical protein